MDTQRRARTIEPKAITTICVPAKILMDAREYKLNVSKICTDALSIATCNVTNSDRVKSDLEKNALVIDQQIKDREKELFNLERRALADRQTAYEASHKLHLDEKLNDFLYKISTEILNNEIGMIYWAKETGKTKDELIRLKLLAKEEADKLQAGI